MEENLTLLIRCVMTPMPLPTVLPPGGKTIVVDFYDK